MSRLSHREFELFQQCLLELYKLSSRDHLAEQLLKQISRAIPADAGGLIAVLPGEKKGSYWSLKPHDRMPQMEEAIVPGLREPPTAAGQLRTADRSCCRISANINLACGSVLYIALDRAAIDFTDSERMILDCFRPHVSQAWRNAEHLDRLQARSFSGRKAMPGTEAISRLAALNLSAREAEVLYWVAQGKTNEEIAIILGVSFFTIKAHLKSIFRRTNVETRSAATARAFECWQAAEGAPDHPRPNGR